MSLEAGVGQENEQRTVASKASAVKPPLGATEGPYVGPRPFDAQDRAWFFGRDREISEIASLIVAHPAVLLYGGCGAGKTSLVNAGLLPALGARGFDVHRFGTEDGGDDADAGARFSRLARVCGPMPAGLSADEVENVYAFNALVSLAGKADEPRDLATTCLAEFLKGKQASHKPLVVIFDQFEELFISYPSRWKERRAFFNQVAEVLSPVEGALSVRVVFAMREDFLSQMEPYARLLPEELRTRYRLESLRENAAIEAVKRPLERTHASVSFAEGAAEGLVKCLLTFPPPSGTGETEWVEGEFVEPMHLQLVCQRIWGRCEEQWGNQPAEPRLITEELINEVGVEAALEDFYDAAVHETARHTSVAEWRLREWCESLITRLGTRSTVLREDHKTAGILNAAVDELDALRLIRAEERSGRTWYELTHDRFIEAIRTSNSKLGIHARRDKLREAALSVVVLALSDLRLPGSSCDRPSDAAKSEPRSGEAASPSALDPVGTLRNPDVELFFWQVIRSSVSDDAKYRKLVRLFELQELLNQRLLEAEEPHDHTQPGIQKLVAKVAYEQGIWRPAELLARTRESIRDGLEYIQRSRRPDGGWGYPEKDYSQLWATGHALMALCGARAISALSLPEYRPRIIGEGIDWVLHHPAEWYVERFPPPEERSMYEVGVGLLALDCARSSDEGKLVESACEAIERSIRGVCGAQNQDGGWDAKIWKEGHPYRKGFFSEVGATSLAVQSLVAWRRIGLPEIKSAILRGVDWLLETQNDDGSWNDGSCEKGTGLRLHGHPSVTKTCDAVRGVRAGIELKGESGAKREHEGPVKRAMEWVRRQERSVQTETGANAIGWGTDFRSHDHPDPVTTCMTLETLAQVDDVSVPLFTANAQWLMDSQDRDPNSFTRGAWIGGDSFRSTFCLVEYYRKIVASPFFAGIEEEAQGGPSA